MEQKFLFDLGNGNLVNLLSCLGIDLIDPDERNKDEYAKIYFSDSSTVPISKINYEKIAKLHAYNNE